MYADTGKRDPYFNAVLAGLHNPTVAGAVTNVLQISVNKQNTQLMAVGNFTTVDGQNRSPDRQVRHRQRARPRSTRPSTRRCRPGTTNLFTSACSLEASTPT